MNENATPTIQQLRTRREEILRIASAHGARNIRVFGSVAANEARVDSDIDFLVEMDPDRNVLDISELILALQDALGREVNVVEIRRPSSMAERIQRESVPL